jgi:hypothetical protein
MTHFSLASWKWKEWLYTDKHTDVTFVFLDEWRREFCVRGHKVLVASRSPILEPLLSSPKFERDGNRILLTDEFEDFLDFLRYLYTDVIQTHNVIGIFKTALKYEVRTGTIGPKEFGLVEVRSP